MRTERLRDLEHGRGDAAPNPPDERPLVRAQARLRHEHAVRGLEDEGNAAASSNMSPAASVDVRRRDDRQLCVRPLRVLADDVDPPIRLLETPG